MTIRVFTWIQIIKAQIHTVHWYQAYSSPLGPEARINTIKIRFYLAMRGISIREKNESTTTELKLIKVNHININGKLQYLLSHLDF